MSLDIYLKPNELSASLLRKAVHEVESAISSTTSAGDEAIAWNDSGNELFTADAQNNLLSARELLLEALERLETCAALMTTSSEEISEIDQVYRTDLKEWKRSGDHTKIGWQFCPASSTTSGITPVSEEETESDRDSSNDAEQEPVASPESGKLPETQPIHLSYHMEGFSTKQNDYSEFEYPYGSNQGCCAVAYAVGLSIVTGQPYDPTLFWRDGEWGYQTYYDAGHRSEWIGYDPKTIYQSLEDGNPTQLAYIYDTSPAEQTDADHFVLVTGVIEGADKNNLQFEDFIVLDPAYGDERRLTEAWRFNPERVTGGFIIS